VQTWVPGDTATHDRHSASDLLALDIAELISSLPAANGLSTMTRPLDDPDLSSLG
jgi:hypothetical protein